MWSIQDAWSLFNKNPWHENLSLGTCETWATTKGIGTVSTNLQHEGILWIFVTFDHLQRWDKTWKKVNEDQSCQQLHVSWSHSSSLCQPCCSLWVAILTWPELSQKSLS